ncbi:hypothetical protein ACGFWG_03915 [Streptomyces sp. NPDC048405]|uniref:hypothetical protein n=1 Tax=unclassified Streptomyces TaxID=2593676 RepID=UPI0035A935DA
MSDKVLSDRLAHLTRAGVVDRDRRPGWPPTRPLHPHPRTATAWARSSKPCGTGACTPRPRPAKPIRAARPALRAPGCGRAKTTPASELPLGMRSSDSDI